MIYIYYTLSVWILLLSANRPGTIFNSRVVSNSLIVILFVLFTGSISSIPIIENSDMWIYVNQIREMSEFSFSKTFDYFNREPFFLMFQWIFSQFSTNGQYFIMVSVMIYQLAIIAGLKKITTGWQVLLILFTFISIPFFTNYIIVAVRQGLSIAFLMLSIGLLLSGAKSYKFIFSIICASLFHWSSIPVSAILLLFKYKRYSLKITLVFWSIAAMLFLLNSQSTIVGFLGRYITKIDLYSSYSTIISYGYKTNRIDFFLISLVILIFSLIMYLVTKDLLHKNLIILYASINSYFLMFGYLSYSDRIVIYSWFLTPLLLWIPIFKFKRHKRIAITTVTLLIIGLSIVTKTNMIFM